MVVTSTRLDLIPSGSFSQTMPNVIADVWVGICKASPTRMIVVTMKDTSGFGIEIASELLSESNQLAARAQIGSVVQALYGQLGSVPIALFLEGTLS